MMVKQIDYKNKRSSLIITFYLFILPTVEVSLKGAIRSVGVEENLVDSYAKSRAIKIKYL